MSLLLFMAAGQMMPDAPPGAALTSVSAQQEAAAPAGAPSDDAIVVSARRHNAPGDPMEGLNLKSFAVTQSVDKAFVGPVAMGYRQAVPQPVRTGLHNALSNLREPTVFINYMLQFKPGKAAETAGRFALNSTLGLAGLFDVAKRPPFHLPHRPNGFADTLGFYGVKPGPYMFMPLVGPTTLRDLVGGGLDRMVMPVSVGQPFSSMAYSVPTGVVSSLDHRVEINTQLNALRDGPSNPYVALRTAYLKQRQDEIDVLKNR